MNFIEKVQSMTAKEIIETMIDAVENPVTKLDMDTYGCVRGGVCYGCAATNTILKLQGIEKVNWQDGNPFVGRIEDKYNIKSIEEVNFINDFELAIDYIRDGNLNLYNGLAKELGIAQIKFERGEYYPSLQTDYTQDELNTYRKLAEAQA